MIKIKEKLDKEDQLKLYLEKIAPMLEQGLKQAEIAEELGYSRQQIERAIKSVSPIREEFIKNGLDPDQWKTAWIPVGNGKYLVTQSQTNENLKTAHEEYLKEAKKYSPKYPKIKRKVSKEGHLLIVDPADIHVGKLASKAETGKEYNSSIAISRVKEGVDNLLNKVYDIDKIVLVIGNDVLHTDNAFSTTKGTIQDTDGMWHDNLILARKMYVEIIERLVTIADVHVVYNISNHDKHLGFGLAESIYCWFSKNKNVTFDITPKPRKYFKYGNSMITTSHGDGAKEKDIPHLAATEEPQMWADTKFRYAYMHHVHHYKKMWVRGGEDSAGFTIEYMRSPSSPDSWHSSKGFLSPMAVEGFVHSKDKGQIMKITNYF